MIGVDISDAQPNFPADWYAQWGFVIAKATEGHSFEAHTFAQKFADAARCAHRGAYHYARPANSGGADQANHFADTALARGFRPGIDVWALDCETGLNEGVSPGIWRQFIVDFMRVATARLGHLGLLYAGYYFWLKQLSGDHSVLAPYRWWLPWYGSNNGELHVPDVQLPQPDFIQQFTSNGGLDRNVVDDAAWSSWLQPQEPPSKPITYPVHTVSEDAVKTALIQFKTGPQGSGWEPFDPQLGRVPVVIGAVLNGDRPAADGTYAFDGEVPIIGVAVENQHVIVQVQHAKPETEIGIWVTVA